MRALDMTRPPALATVVEARLREAIMFGDLSLGEAVSEDRLATMLGVSRTPVREALTALQLQGLITILPQRGSFVFQPTEQDIAELCAFRALIEVEAMTLAHARARDATLTQLKQSLAAMVKAESEGRQADAAQADAAFHNAFVSNSGNRPLSQAYTLVSGRVGAILSFARGSKASRRNSNTEHRAIIQSFAAGDLAVAATVLRPHILNMHVRFVEAQLAIATKIKPSDL
jgi:DNA-binding GntR family transcriptional regulator